MHSYTHMIEKYLESIKSLFTFDKCIYACMYICLHVCMHAWMYNTDKYYTRNMHQLSCEVYR